MNFTDDRNLIIRAKMGDREAFGELTRLYQTRIYNLTYRMLGNHRDAEDTAQEAFMRAFSALDTFDSTRPFSPWLKKIAINICLNKLKADRPSQSLEDEVSVSVEGIRKTETIIAHHERDLQIREAIRSLSPYFRAVVELRHYQDMSYSEISEALNRPLSSVKSDLFRARKILSQVLLTIVED
jgi:RNA polymerase sigma-70 factor (ECF subfamily)